MDKLKVGIVGVAGRGGSFQAALDAAGAQVHAVCDLQADKLEACARQFGAEQKYTDYEQMIQRAKLDAVVVGTPMHLHVPQSIMALENNISVLCEVPAGVSVDECRRLVLAAKRSKATYMMAENYIYIKTNILVRELVRQGLFGEVYYAEGEYLHELKELNEITVWRRKWQTGIEGITYGTHSLGPILQWMPGDRVTRVCCEGSGHHFRDPRGEPYHSESPVMLCKTARGALIKIRVDMLSERPHAMSNYQLQGTDGVFESHRDGPGERSKIWLKALSHKVQWLDVHSVLCADELAAKYLPEMWRNPPKEALRAGHGGGDYFEVIDFIRGVRGETRSPIGLHESMDMTLPGLISQQSILQGGAWLPVPNSRDWQEGRSDEQLQMVVPAQQLSKVEPPNVPADYQLRVYEDADQSGYIELMAKAGFEGWTAERLQKVLRSVLPGGLFVIVHKVSGQLVATAMAAHNPQPQHPFGGELGWVAGDPAHAGKGLGLAVCAAVLRRFAEAGYRHVYLNTDDHRLPAIKTYLKLGFQPFCRTPEMEDRWQRTAEALKAPRR